MLKGSLNKFIIPVSTIIVVVVLIIPVIHGGGW
jgi:hypothetical protein